MDERDHSDPHAPERSVVISGGNRGIGAALVEACAAHGWHVAFTFRQHEDEAAALAARVRDAHPEARILYARMDVRDSEAVEDTVSGFADELGSIDALVCNAGVSRNGLAFMLGDDAWDEVIDTNLSGAFRLCRAALPTMLAQRKGRILLMSSIVAAGATGQAAYAASKAGLVGLAGSLAREYGRRGVSTNVIMPGFFDTEMTRSQLSGANRDFAMQFCPMGRIGDLAELAEIVAFLLSDAAAYINGAAIPVSGGLGWVP